ncbi:MAG: hypothetical protein JNL88_03945 [Bacteroidia bacterium]|nr:hypothetical protein [Bacteroidia bacterium]
MSYAVTGFAGTDSLISKSRIFRADLSGSYAAEKNWWNGEQQAVQIRGLAEARFRKSKASGWKHDHFLHSQMGYTGFKDSLWIKSADIFKVQLRWMEKRGVRLTHTYSISLQSQWLNTWSWTGDVKSWQGGFMNPSTLEAGYGFTFTFLQQSYLVLIPATLQVQVQPGKTMPAANDERPFFTAASSRVYSRYGFSGVLQIDENFYENRLQWQHQSRLFFNNLTERQIRFDISNRVCIRFLKHLQLRLETSIQYLPEQSLRLQYRQEVLLGIFYEYRK